MQEPLTRIPMIVALAVTSICTVSFGADDENPKKFKVHPIGFVKVEGDQTFIVLDKKYEPGLLRMDTLAEICVL